MKKKSIIESRKFYKRNKILEIIRKEKDVSKYYLQQQTSYSMTTIMSIVDELIDCGYIYESESNENKVGRRPVWLKINPTGVYTVGLEFNGNVMHCVLINMMGDVLVSNGVKINRDDCLENIINLIFEQIQLTIDFLEEAEHKKILGIGVGVPGYFDDDSGIALNYSTIPAWKNVPIIQMIENRFNMPCYIENNVNVMAFAYRWMRQQTMPENYIFVSVRTGVRIVPVVKEKLVLSRSGSSGQLGHTKVMGRNRKCHCGKFGCLNTEVTETGIVSNIVEGYLVSRQYKNIIQSVNGDFTRINIDTITDAINKQDPEMDELICECAQRLGEALGIMVDIFSPQEIQLSGPIFRFGDYFLKQLSKSIKNNAIKENAKKLKIRLSHFKADVGAIGAATLVLEENFESIDEKI